MIINMVGLCRQTHGGEVDALMGVIGVCCVGSIGRRSMRFCLLVRQGETPATANS